jgi:hypothetical protein
MTPSPAATATAQPKSGKLGLVIGCVVCLLLGAFIGHALTYHAMEHRHGQDFQTPFQAVVLSNGAVYYGKLTGYGTRHVELTDVFYIVSKTDPTTKQVTNVLVKRGKELHEPDRMYVNANQIVFVEPVGPNSKVAQLISQNGQ